MYKGIWSMFIGIGIFSATLAFAGNPHFVDDKITVSCGDDSVSVSGKEGGLGDETQVHIVLTAMGQCVNRGGNEPSADNKDEVAAESDFPVQNGKANFSLTAVADFQPDCSPPMTVVFSDIQIADVEHGLVRSLGDCP